MKILHNTAFIMFFCVIVLIPQLNVTYSKPWKPQGWDKGISISKIKDTTYGSKYQNQAYEALISAIVENGSDIQNSLTSYSSTEINPITKPTNIYMQKMKDCALRNSIKLNITKEQVKNDPIFAIVNVLAFKIVEYGKYVYNYNYHRYKAKGFTNNQTHYIALRAANNIVLKLYDSLTKYRVGMTAKDVDIQYQYNEVISQFSYIDEKSKQVYIKIKILDGNEVCFIYTEGDLNETIKTTVINKYISELDK